MERTPVRKECTAKCPPYSVIQSGEEGEVLAVGLHGLEELCHLIVLTRSLGKEGWLVKAKQVADADEILWSGLGRSKGRSHCR